MENVDWCEPNMISNIKSSSDPYYPYQFYLNNTDAEGVDINVVPAWTLITGDSNVKVAVLDEGVDIYHEDFEGNVLSGYSVNSPYGLGNVINSTFNHGTSCAGIIAAVHNNIGVRGVAGGVKILPVNITKGTRDNFGNTIFSEHDSIANAIRWAVDHGADILSCSWGGNFESNSITDAIIYARTFGRLGKGSVVVAASGNYFESLPYVVMFPARANGVVAVGAVDRDGTICDYSQRGAMLDIVAPSKKSYNTEGIYTTYNMGEGNIGNNYTSTFGGTSAACPQVAGVAALMLSANPYLSEEQVRSRLQSTATDLGETGFDSTYGYGLVNAFAAVKASIMDMLGSTVLCGSKFYSVANLPTGASVSWSLINGNISCVSLQSDSPSANQCTLTLTNSSGFNSVTLKADVIMSGTVVKSLQKVISRALPFSGTYEEASLLYNGSFTPSIPQTTIPGSREMDVYAGGLVKVKSDYFSGKSISISGPYTNYYRSGSLVRFTLSSWSGAPVVITVQAEGCDDEVQLKFFPAVMLDDYSLNISPDGNSTYTLSLIRKTEDGVLPETSSAADDCAAPRQFSKPWTLEVTNALTGRKAFSKEVAEPSFLLHTDGWEAGVYVVRALVGDESLAGKITVK